MGCQAPKDLSVGMIGPGDCEELVRLLGQPHLADYLDLVATKVPGGEAISPRDLADEWRRANDHYHELELSEAGIADHPDCLDPPPAMRPLIDALRRNPYFAKTFDTLPTEVRMVELARLIASQAGITCDFADDLQTRLGTSPDPESLFHFCLPVERPSAPVQVRKLAAGRYMFISDSTDFRFHNPEIIDAAAIAGLTTFGPVSQVLALPVGYGSNYISVIESEGRLLLQNGYHRCYSLLKAGITHAPAIVQRVTRLDELSIAADEKVCDNPSFYFRAARPPLLKDFLDPRLSKRLTVRKMQTTVEIEFKVRTSSSSIL